jgi:hypothetical protein
MNSARMKLHRCSITPQETIIYVKNTRRFSNTEAQNSLLLMMMMMMTMTDRSRVAGSTGRNGVGVPYSIRFT